MAVCTLCPLFTQASDPAQVETKYRIEVTGSHIKRADLEGPQPILVIDRSDLDRHAGHTLMQVLSQLPLNNLGAFSQVAAAVSLRGLGANTTLVLLNGRRLANAAFAAGPMATINFVDLNTIPAAAVERIEILRDGASAIYGSDAIAGVVNIILRRDFRGLEASAGFGASGKGDARETAAAITAGYGDLGTQRLNALITLDYYKEEPLLGSDRFKYATADRRPFGGPDFRSPLGSPGTWLTASSDVPAAQRLPTNTVFPACPAESRNQQIDPRGVCAYDYGPIASLTAGADRVGAVGRVVYQASPALSAFTEAMASRNEVQTQAAPFPDQFVLPVGHNSNPFPFAVPINYRFLDIGPRIDNYRLYAIRALLGVKGMIGDWDWEVAHVRAINDIRLRASNFLYGPARNALVAEGIYNFVDPSRNDPALAERLRIALLRTGKGHLQSWDAKASGPVAALPGGDLVVAVGGEWREADVKDTPDPNVAAGLIFGTGATSVEGRRSMSAVWGELAIPVSRHVEGQIAVRSEDHGSFGRSIVPKVAIALRPIESVLLRAGYNRGFREPSLAEQFVGETLTFPRITDSTRCAAYTTALGASDSRTQSVCTGRQVPTYTRGNPNLEPETSITETVGAVWDITPRLSFALDWYHIRHRQRIAFPPASYVLANESSFAGFVARDVPGPDDVLAGTVGPITAFHPRFFNLASQATRGVDFEGRARVDLGRWGRAELTSLNTYMDYLRRSPLPGVAASEIAGTGGVPRYRGSHSVRWTLAPWDVSVVANVIGNHRVTVIPGQLVLDSGTRVWYDAHIACALSKSVRLAIGIRNLADKDLAEVGAGAQLGDSVVGRFFYARASWKLPGP